MRFGGIVALDDASLDVQSGTIHGLIGRNGSGKSTLFNCVTGFLKPTHGEVSIGDRVVTGLPPQAIVRAGVARTFQTPRIDTTMTVHDAVLCGFFPSVRHGLLSYALGVPQSRREERALRLRADELLERLGLEGVRDAQIGTLSMGRVRLIEVARGIAAGAAYLLLDEPAAGLGSEERDLLAAQLRAVAASGIGVLLVEHNFSLIRALCARVTVLDAGRVLCAGTPDEVSVDPRVIAAYLGSSDERVLLEVV